MECDAAFNVAGIFVSAYVGMSQIAYENGKSAEEAFGNPIDAESVKDVRSNLKRQLASRECLFDEVQIDSIVDQFADEYERDASN
jgi:hypothetical protein